MVAVPAFSAVTLILFAVTSMEFAATSSADAMEMMSVSSVLQTTLWLASAGVTLAVRMIASPSSTVVLAVSELISTAVGLTVVPATVNVAFVVMYSEETSLPLSLIA